MVYGRGGESCICTWQEFEPGFRSNPQNLQPKMPRPYVGCSKTSRLYCHRRNTHTHTHTHTQTHTHTRTHTHHTASPCIATQQPLNLSILHPSTNACRAGVCERGQQRAERTHVTHGAGQVPSGPQGPPWRVHSHSLARQPTSGRGPGAPVKEHEKGERKR